MWRIVESLLLVVLIGFALTAAGAWADFFLRKAESNRVKRAIADAEAALRSIPLGKWQVSIARAGITALEYVHRKGIELACPHTPALERWLTRIPPEAPAPRQLLKILASAVLLPAVPLLVPLLYLGTSWWFLAPFVLPSAVLLLAMLQAVGMAVLSKKDPNPNTRLFELERLIFGASAGSALLTLSATLVSVSLISPPLAGSYWFVFEAGRTVPASPLLMAAINFPFDLATLWITYRLLRRVHRRERGFLVAAAVDSAAAIVLSVLLLAALSLIRPDSPSTLLDSLRYSVGWFFRLSRGQGAARDLNLLPILLSTLAPVAIYMGVFVALALAKLLLRVIARVCGLIAEEEKSVFAQLGTAVGITMIAIQALYTYLSH